MLLWALWLAASMLRWIRWGWERFSAGGYWPEKKGKPGDATEKAPASPAAATEAPVAAATASSTPTPSPQGRVEDDFLDDSFPDDDEPPRGKA